MSTQMSNFGLIFEQVTGSAPGHSSNAAQLYASSSTNEGGTTQLFMKDSAGNEVPIGGSFKLEDGDGTELAISGGAQVKFIDGGGTNGLDINWTDVSHGIDGDEYDLEFKIDIANLAATTTVDDADLVMIDDGAGGTLRKMTRAHFIESAALDAINIDGGAIDGTPIGENSASTAKFSTLTVTDDVAITGTLGVQDNVSIADDKKLQFGNGNDASFEYDEDGTDTLLYAGASLRISDDVKLEFGTGGDASIEYDENGTDELRFAGAAVTFEQNVSMDSDVTLGLDANDVVTVAGELTASLGLSVPDDKKVYFGTGFDASIEYDEDGTDELRIAGAAARFEQNVAIEGNVTLGNASSDTISATGQFNTDLVPSTDNARDLGSSAKQWKDLYVNGAAHIDALGQSLDAGDFNISNLNALTASAIQVEILDVVTINSVTQSDVTLEVEDKLIVSALSASSANSDGGGLKIGGGSTTVGHAAVLWNHASSSLDLSVGDESQVLVQNGAVVPSRDNDVDLGASGAQYKDLYVNGIGYIDQLGTDADPVAAYISSGEIDGTVIGGESAAAATFTTVTVNTSLVPDAVGGADLGSTSAELGDIYIADDKKVQFGNDQDATIEYDADGTSELRFAGAAVTFEQNVSMDSNVTLGLDANDVVTVAGELTASLGLSIPDDKKLYFGNGFDASFEYDEDGNDVLLYAGANMRFDDDTKLEFGAGGDATIEYDENGTDELRFAGAAVTFEQNVSMDSNVTLGLDANDVVTVAGELTASLGLSIPDDKKLYFGTGFDASIEYDEDGTDVLRFAGAGAVFEQDVSFGAKVSGSNGLAITGDGVFTQNLAAQGQLQAAGNIITDAGAAAIVFDGSGNTSLQGNLSAGNGYSNGGYSVTTGGAFSGAGNMIVGRQGTGASFTAFGPDAGSSMQWNGASGSILFKYDNGGTATEIMNVGVKTSSEFAIDVRDGANNVNKIRAAAFVTYSDESLKSDVASMSNTALDTVMSLEGVEFTWKNSGERDFGFIAQDVQKVVPKAVHTAQDGVQGVDYSRLTSILVEAVKSQQVQIEELKNTISKLKK